eukprot:TRINITY_DN22150_c0_g1_i2.p1 TRINITY_DN22150_c0_g1~~TRINITY_DN22150_c0_g1_i2.p1  ORF type:complete len:402 (+),score=55.15 TRINITY_DN22150_c0_g1_i2:75-1280(+)
MLREAEYGNGADEIGCTRILQAKHSKADETPRVEQLEENLVDIPEDAYGSVIFAIAHDFGIICSRKSDDEAFWIASVQTFFAVVLLVLNLMMQGLLLYFFHSYVVLPSIHSVQTSLANFRATVYTTDSVFQEDKWKTFYDKAELCNIGMLNNTFYYMVVFIWTLEVIKEFRVSERLTRDMINIKGVSSVSEMCLDNDGEVQVVGLTWWSRFLIFAFVIIPKFVICLALLYLGCSWLSASTSFTDLVMNSIAMEFVSGIDELLYHCMLSAAHRKQITDVKLVVYSKKAPNCRAKEFQAFKRSAAYLAFAFIFVGVYANCIQQVLPSDLSHAKMACAHYWNKTESNLCLHAEGGNVFHQIKKSFTGLNFQKCFPYGMRGDMQFENAMHSASRGHVTHSHGHHR